MDFTVLALFLNRKLFGDSHDRCHICHMTRYLSGIQPTGKPHLGNYFGAIKEHITLGNSAAPGEALFFVADYHALTTERSAEELAYNIRSVAATYIALGLDIENSILFRQSDVPQVLELAWILSTSTGMGLLERAHSYKDKIAKGLKPNVGLFTYPILMAADILLYAPDVVPVGKDQVQHIEMTNDMATAINQRFGAEHLKKVRTHLSKTPKVPGIDGEKMSSSYGNDIWIFEEGKKLKKRCGKIVTDSRSPEEPKNPDELIPYQLLELVDTTDSLKTWRERIERGGQDAPGYGHLKMAVRDAIDAYFSDARERYQYLMDSEKGQKELEYTLTAGAVRAREIADNTLDNLRKSTGLSSV